MALVRERPVWYVHGFMDRNGWLREFRAACEQSGPAFHDSTASLLMQEASEETLAPEERKTLNQLLKAMLSHFMRKGHLGSPFGPVGRIKERFGQSLEERYGVVEGPFLNLARTYWTFKLEADLDFSDTQSDKSTWLAVILGHIEEDMAALFFPTPGPAAVSVDERRKAQKEFLQDHIPEMNIDLFLEQNPFLKARKSGCLAFMLAFILCASILISVL